MGTHTSSGRLWEMSLTLGEEEVGHERAFEGGLPELQAVWDLAQQELHHNQKLVHLRRGGRKHSGQGACTRETMNGALISSDTLRERRGNGGVHSQAGRRTWVHTNQSKGI